MKEPVWVRKIIDWVFDGRTTDLDAVHASNELARNSVAASITASDQLIESGRRISRMANDLRRYQSTRKQ